MHATEETDQSEARQSIANQPETHQAEASAPASQDEPSLKELIAAARQGDQTVTLELRSALRAAPERAIHLGALATKAHMCWLDRIAGKDLYFRECLSLHYSQMRESMLKETNGTVVERMLVDQAVSTWLQVYYCECLESVAPMENVKLSEYCLKKTESAHNRHLRSLSALTAVKKVSFTKRMAEAMEAAVQAAQEPSDATEQPSGHSRSFAPITPHNRVSGSLGRLGELAPLN